VSLKPSKKLVGGALALAIATVGTFEGLRTKAYRDVVGIPTVCYGETRGVKIGDTHTVNECKDMLASRLDEFNAGVDRCLLVPVSDSRRVALVSFSYNVGLGAFCKSTLVRRLNANDPHACDELLKWNKAGGRVLAGLTKRRHIEHDLCEG